jgi:hypothetical protein
MAVNAPCRKLWAEETLLSHSGSILSSRLRLPVTFWDEALKTAGDGALSRNDKA